MPMFVNRSVADSIQEGLGKLKKNINTYPDVQNETYQFLFTKDLDPEVIEHWKAVFGSIQDEVNDRCLDQMCGRTTLSDHKVLFNNTYAPPAEQY
eukprot:10120650-Ditylum_brightwellii.AAC.1